MFLFVVALAATLAVEMNARLMVQVQKNSNIQLFQQAKWYAYGAEALAKRVLIETKEKDPDIINLEQAWAEEERTFPVEDGTITGKITDLQACLNLNALRAEGESGQASNIKNPAHTAFLNLLKKAEDLPIEETEESLADSLYDWLDEDSIPKGQGVEEGEYMSYELPYLTANHYIASVSELRVIRGFNPLVIEQLRPYLCALPQTDLFEINVNTIQAEQALLLAAVLDIDESSAERLIGERPDEGWKDSNAFIQEAKQNGAKSLKDKDDRFVVTSRYFEMATVATFAESRFGMRSVLYVEEKK